MRARSEPRKDRRQSGSGRVSAGSGVALPLPRRGPVDSFSGRFSTGAGFARTERSFRFAVAQRRAFKRAVGSDAERSGVRGKRCRRKQRGGGAWNNGAAVSGGRRQCAGGKNSRADGESCAARANGRGRTKARRGTIFGKGDGRARDDVL